VNIKSFAQQHNLTIKKVREVCEEVFQTIPTELTEEQVKELTEVIYNAAQSVALPQSEETTETTGELTTTQPTNLQETSEQNQRIIEIIGVKVLQKNLLLYLQNVKASLAREKFKAESLTFQAEQYFYTELSRHQQSTQNESLARMERNGNIWNSQNIQAMTANDSEESELLESLAALMTEMAL
jgi:hypothetical protein